MMAIAPPTAAPLTWRGLLAGLSAIPAHGKRRATLQRVLATCLGAPAAFLADSGRSVLYLLLRRLAQADPHRHGVVMPAYGCPAVAQVIRDLGLTLRLVDVVPQTLDYEPDLLRRAVDQDILAVMLIHPLGLPMPLSPAQDAAQRAGAWLIEDAAQGFGATLDDGRPAGGAGDFGIVSFGPGKPLSAGGGGALSANTPRAAALATEAWVGLADSGRLGAALGWARAAALDMVFRPFGWAALSRLGLDRIGNDASTWSYRLVNLSESQAALALDGLGRLPDMVAARRRHAAALSAALEGSAILRPALAGVAGQPSFLRYPVLATDHPAREETLARLRAAGIAGGRLYPHALNDLLPDLPGTYPGAASLALRLLTLPTHPRLSKQDVTQICRAICQIAPVC
jgi:dTDP-4-amino-4,6-dideoxygalactose transaminase